MKVSQMDYIGLRVSYPGGKYTRIQFQRHIASTLLGKKLGKNSGLVIQMFFDLFGATDDETLLSIPPRTSKWRERDFHHLIYSKLTKTLAEVQMNLGLKLRIQF